MCDKNNDIKHIDIINMFLPILSELEQEECLNCRQPCEDIDENESWQYFDGNKYCYDCWEELKLESKL